MRRIRSLLVVSLLVVGLLAGCGGSTAGTAVSKTSSPDAGLLNTNYDNALPIISQLAAGTLKLDGTDQAVDEAEAGNILPLWQAYQSLSNSDTTAEAELTAVINQIENTMTPEQVKAIADMKLTQDSLTAMVNDGTLAFGRGNPTNAGSANNNSGSSGAPGGGFPAGGFGGGPPGGGVPGGGFGGGTGGGQSNFNESDIATRQAAGGSGNASAFQDRALIGAVIRLLETKTGATPEPQADPFAALWDVLTKATGLTVEEIQTQTSDGKTLTDLIEANGGNIDTVKADLITALENSPIAQRQNFDLDAYVTNMLMNSNPGLGPYPGPNTGSNTGPTPNATPETTPGATPENPGNNN